MSIWSLSRALCEEDGYAGRQGTAWSFFSNSERQKVGALSGSVWTNKYC